MKIVYASNKVKLQCTSIKMDEIAPVVKIVEIREVSPHYE